MTLDRIAGASDTRRWAPGSHIILREVWRGTIWTIRPVTVVQDTPELVALYLAPGTPCKHPRRLDGTPIRLAAEPWHLVDATWPWSTLRLHIPGEAHEVWPARRDVPTINSWYVNLQEPLRRTVLGFDYMDQVLDIIISADLSEWHWKDEDELDEAQALGLMSGEQVQAIRAEGERVIQLAMARGGFFAGGWYDWSPPSTWTVPAIPPGWDLL